MNYQNWYGNNGQYYMQNLQDMKDRIDNQMKQYQQSQMQMQQPQIPQINQNFQITPTTNNNNDIQAKYVNNINDVKNTFVMTTGLFVNNKNTKLARNTINAICKRAYKLIGITETKHYSPHTLRHTSATIMYQYVKQDTLLLKKFLGHSSIASTQIYTHIYDERVKNAVESNPLSNFNLK